jgi:hypothetical protein
MEKQKIRRSLSGILLLGIFFNFFPLHLYFQCFYFLPNITLIALCNYCTLFYDSYFFQHNLLLYFIPSLNAV